MDLTLSEIRRLSLAQQGLLGRNKFGKGINAVESVINRLHYVQIDTISVVERAHHQVLRSRIANYDPSMLATLLQEQRRIFEYWFHAAAFLPMQDYRYSLLTMQGYASKKSIDKKLRAEIIQRISTEGPLQSRDFVAPEGHKSSGWWSWKPAKVALETLFLSGELMVSERRGFQKVYDLAENVLPSHIETSIPSESERGHYYVQRMLSALGPAQAKDIGYPRATVKRFSRVDIQIAISKALQELVEAGEVVLMPLNGKDYYCLSTLLTAVPKRIGTKSVIFLSPFDNVLINRRRLLEVFGFDYQLECYVPAAKRKYGYFCLPILFGDQFIGRMDCKAERSRKRLLIKNVWLEQNIALTDELLAAFLSGMRAYMADLGCASVQLTNCNSSKLMKFLNQQSKRWQ